MDFLILFGLGVLGALITIYIAQQDVVPEFRPFFDTEEREQEAKDLREHNKKTREEIDKIQTTLQGGVLPKDQLQQLGKALDTSQRELEYDRRRLESLERKINQGKVAFRTIGFILYAILGGAIAALLSDKVKVEGFDATLPKQFQAIFVGASWTGFLSVLGFSTTSQKAGKGIEALKKEILDAIDKKTAEAGAKNQPLPVDELKREIKAMVDTRSLVVQRAVKGLL
ncbi:MAG: hypothetical protein HYX97_02105 [Chloroflexi bacterium]|nr:hypothetical protein [Chloroflexota bacterium]